MNSKESIDLMKMAISILMASLLVGALVFSVFYNMNIANKFDKAMVNATNSSRMDRLRDLADMSAGDVISDYPLVTQVISALDAFTSEEVLYIAMIGQTEKTVGPDMRAVLNTTEDGPNIGLIFYYDGYEPDRTNDAELNNQLGSYTLSERPHTDPIKLAQEHLMHYAQCRAKVLVEETENHWSYITVTLYWDKEVLPNGQ